MITGGDFVNREALRSLDTAELERAVREDAMPVDLYKAMLEELDRRNGYEPESRWKVKVHNPGNPVTYEGSHAEIRAIRDSAIRQGLSVSGIGPVEPDPREGDDGSNIVCP